MLVLARLLLVLVMGGCSGCVEIDFTGLGEG